MPRKENITSDKFFEDVYKRLYLNHIAEVRKELMNQQPFKLDKKEMKKRVDGLLSMECAFRLKHDVGEEKVCAVREGDPKFLMKGVNEIEIKKFFKLIYPYYLEPYFTYAGFTNKLPARQSSINANDMLGLVYQIMMPIKFPDGHYNWFLQKSFVISISQSNQVLSHINIYDYVGVCDLINEDENNFEYRLIKAAILKDGLPNNQLTALLNRAWNENLLDKIKIKGLLPICKFYIKYPEKSIKETHDEFKNKGQLKIYRNPDKIGSARRQLLKVVSKQSGYRFQSIPQLIRYFDAIGLTDEISNSR